MDPRTLKLSCTGAARAGKLFNKLDYKLEEAWLQGGSLMSFVFLKLVLYEFEYLVSYPRKSPKLNVRPHAQLTVHLSHNILKYLFT